MMKLWRHIWRGGIWWSYDVTHDFRLFYFRNFTVSLYGEVAKHKQNDLSVFPLYLFLGGYSVEMFLGGYSVEMFLGGYSVEMFLTCSVSELSKSQSDRNRQAVQHVCRHVQVWTDVEYKDLSSRSELIYCSSRPRLYLLIEDAVCYRLQLHD